MHSIPFHRMRIRHLQFLLKSEVNRSSCAPFSILKVSGRIDLHTSLAWAILPGPTMYTISTLQTWSVYGMVILWMRRQCGTIAETARSDPKALSSIYSILSRLRFLQTPMRHFHPEARMTRFAAMDIKLTKSHRGLCSTLLIKGWKWRIRSILTIITG